MKTACLTIALLTSSLLTWAAPQPATFAPAPGDSATHTLTVGFPNPANRSGVIYVGLANDEVSFAGASYRYARVTVPATGEVTVQFKGMPAGRYAVRVYQDLNDNTKLDYAGPMPTEPFGFSTIQILTGRPTFAACAFDLNETKTIAITLIGK